MNLRYECLDARDDFHAQMKKGVVATPFGIEFGDGLEGSVVNTSVPKGDGELGDDDMGIAEGEFDVDMSHIGNGELRRCKEIATMKEIMQQSGWTEPRPSLAAPEIPAIKVFKRGIEWKADVEKLRQAIIDQRYNEQAKTFQDPLSTTNSILSSGEVKVVDKSYLEQSKHSVTHKNILDDLVVKFHLNNEQERAFRIVANHACEPQSEQLKMYIGGMGGTGKTQVLKAIAEFFQTMNRAREFLIVAPTGTAAALLGGSTYHYLFGFNERPDANLPNNLLLQLRARLQGVSYIFLDEVSMLSCHDMYHISARLAKILNVADKPFGGMNMLFAGDFAQLPPAIGQEHAALYSRTVGLNSTSVRQQEAAIGKALWHQVTTVVILQQNMRQRQQTKEDAQLRQALTNMRYKACTPEDITFLRSCVTSQLPGRASITADEFRNVSIITALNIHKDEINRLGSLGFAQETQQELVEFFSEDSFNIPVDLDATKTIKPYWKRGHRLKRKPMVMTENLQKCLWNQPPSTNDKGVPGKLSICKGMPMIIHKNMATELCITRGQEAFVHSWQSTIGSRGQQVLDTLFVKLQNPPQPVQFEGLPLNVVPLPKSSVTVKCTLPNDNTIMINRQQVEVLPNFAMTDYSSQGKTRLYNPIDLNNCRTHQSYYTALSRSASAAGTCIVQGFDPKKVMGGASGALRQEFCELELLNDIVLHRYEGKLPEVVTGDCRSKLIHAFRHAKGENYVPKNVHKAVRWSKSDLLLLDIQDTMPWQIVQKANNTDSSDMSKPATQLSQSLKHENATNEITSSTIAQLSQCVLKRKLDDATFFAPNK